ncbi:MAG TPA: DMT family transporter [Kiloniellaceae bacterium]|nr:DMT family transporter [Kiloniellaceae bacterium]
MPIEMLFAILIALLVGAGFPMQAAINATIAQYHGHPLLAAFTNTSVASLVLLVAILLLRVPWPPLAGMAAAPWWAWSGGALGAFFVLSSLVLAPKLGAAAFVATTIVGTMAASLAMDHFGLIAFRQQPITLLRLGGAVLVVTGMIMIQWKR